MEDSKTKYIESSLAAFRAINTFWFLNGPYSHNSSTELWNEEDYKEETSRRIMREDFERHLEILANVYNTHVKTLYYTVPNIESEYNNIVINARNMEQAVSLFKEKFEKAMFALENECDANQLLKNYLLPLQEHGIITIDEGNDYQELVCRIVMYYTEAVNVICSVFHLERPWNRMTVISDKALTANTSANYNESDSEDNDKHEFNHYDLSHMPSYQPIKNDGPDLKELYRFLRDEEIATNADESLFIEYVTHAFFTPIYCDGNKVNILYVIAQLKPYYDDGWLKAVCKDLGVSEKRITQRLPRKEFRDAFPSLTFRK